MPNGNSIKSICDFPDCGRPVLSRGLCSGHYQQKSKGKPLIPVFSKKRPDGTPPRIEYREVPCLVPGLIGPCHEWTGYKSDKGYGSVGIGNRKTMLVHRYVWELANGQIPDGLVTDHQCRNTACCNVNHLRIVTNKVNTLENSFSTSAINAAKTHCKRGHPFDEANTYVGNNGSRHCRKCQATYRRKS